ncbi:MAG: beta-L-arabinofuranosidase domain-containing protein [Phycisphaerae bacterium]
MNDNPLKTIAARDVKVGGLMGQRIELTWQSNLLALDWDRDFLAPFLAKNSDPGAYIGLGKSLDGLVRLAAHTGDERLLAKRRHILDMLLSAQAADGYLGHYRPDDRGIPTWDAHEQAYVLMALVVDWQLFREERSLAAAQRLGHWLMANLSAEVMPLVGKRTWQGQDTYLSRQLVLIGYDRALLALYRATGEPSVLDYCVDTLRVPQWDQAIVEGRFGPIEGHVYGFLSHCLAQLDLFEITGDRGLLAQTRRAIEYLRDRQALVISGTNGITECWHSDQTGSGDLGETCATAYLIRLLSHLLQIEGDGWYGDWMERSIYNALFAAQSPDGRRLSYYVPLEGERHYWDRDTYCCPGNFRRIIGELPEMIFYRQADGITVNLYTESSVTTALADGTPLVLRQHTDYPHSGQVRLDVEPARSARFALRLRRPAWCAEFAVAVNGQTVPPGGSAHFAEIPREWRPGDQVTIAMPMPWRLVRGFRNQAGKVAAMRGPQLYCRATPSDAAVEFRTDGIATNLGLMQFPDPGGRVTYFACTDSPLMADDELFPQGLAESQGK